LFGAVAKGGRVPLAYSSAPSRWFWRCSLTRAPTLGYMNVFSDNYLGKLSAASYDVRR